MWKKTQRCAFYVAMKPLIALEDRRERKLLTAAIKAHCGNLDLRCAPELANDSRLLFDCIVDAVQLVKEIDERKFNWIWNGMSRFYVSRELPAQFWVLHETCVLNASKLAAKTRSDIAATIIHEATHAKLSRAGIFIWPDIRLRIERICVREEIRFFRRLGGAGWRGIEPRLEWYAQLLQRLADKS